VKRKRIVTEKDVEGFGQRVYREKPEAPEPSKTSGVLSRIFGRQRDYWYVTTTVNGRLYILGPYVDEEKALETAGTELGDTDFELVELPTRDRSKATQLMRARVLEETHNLPYAVRRTKHQPPKKRKL